MILNGYGVIFFENGEKYYEEKIDRKMFGCLKGILCLRKMKFNCFNFFFVGIRRMGNRG